MTENKEIHCPNCGKVVEQTPETTKPRKFCNNNKKCYYEYYGKIGGFRRAMRKHLKKHPETRIKMRKNAKEYNEKKRGLREDLFCKECGALIEDLRRTATCSPKCQKIRQARNNLKYQREHKPKQYCKNCGKLLLDNRLNYCSEECRKVAREEYRKNYWAKPVNKIRRDEKLKQRAREKRRERIEEIEEILRTGKLEKTLKLLKKHEALQRLKRNEEKDLGADILTQLNQENQNGPSQDAQDPQITEEEKKEE